MIFLLISFHFPNLQNLPLTGFESETSFFTSSVEHALHRKFSPQ